MADPLYCFRCGESLEALSLPLSRLDECPACTIPLHTCRMCIFYDPGAVDQCLEDDAERVVEKARANFCDYFKPNAEAYDPAEKSAEDASRSAADDLFE
jgi:hypothetical protein